jgi:hypothetical protein
VPVATTTTQNGQFGLLHIRPIDQPSVDMTMRNVDASWPFFVARQPARRPDFFRLGFNGGIAKAIRRAVWGAPCQRMALSSNHLVINQNDDDDDNILRNVLG